MRKGIRCDICVGCGLCPGVTKDMQIVTAGREQVKVNLQNDGHIRYVTADVGTTTIAMQLHREDGSVEDSLVTVNPQVKYGADVISRITAAEHREAAEDMCRMVREVLERGLAQFKKRLSGDESLSMVLTANTTMVYLLMNRAVGELGRAPFAASHLEGLQIELAGVSCYIFPGLSAFVGGDVTAGIYAGRMLEREQVTLLIDLGTNGEMVLGNRHKLLACATAAGPAFEGGVNRGIWGADMVSLIARMRREGLLSPEGELAEPYFDTGVLVGNVRITQQAVRAIQLAKAAIATGITILMQEYGCSMEEIDEVILAGGFGYFLKAEDAAEIGLLPEKLVKKTVTGGNTALAGALWAACRICSGEAFLKVTDIGERKEMDIKLINLAEYPEFESRYIDALALTRW